MNVSEASFWNQRWKTGQTGWDIGYASPPITEFMEVYENKEAAILIPGCGNAYEAEFLAEKGFMNISLLDISVEAVRRLKEKFGVNSQINVINGNFFTHEGGYDLILEQTFFCALDPKRRKEYVEKIHELLNPDGRLVGVMFDFEFEKAGPPFGGSRSEYEKLFSPLFEINKMEPCYNSIKPRKGRELFVDLTKK